MVKEIIRGYWNTVEIENKIMPSNTFPFVDIKSWMWVVLEKCSL